MVIPPTRCIETNYVSAERCIRSIEVENFLFRKLNLGPCGLEDFFDFFDDNDSQLDSQEESNDESLDESSFSNNSDDDTDNNPNCLQRLTDELRTTLSLLDSEQLSFDFKSTKNDTYLRAQFVEGENGGRHTLPNDAEPEDYFNLFYTPELMQRVRLSSKYITKADKKNCYSDLFTCQF